MILRMVFYADASLSQVVEDNSTVSLERVNSWNRGVLGGLQEDEQHDVAVWITRAESQNRSTLFGSFLMKKIKEKLRKSDLNEEI